MVATYTQLLTFRLNILRSILPQGELTTLFPHYVLRQQLAAG
jgi:hypothetical protein